MTVQFSSSFFFTSPPPTAIHTLSLHDALPISAHAAELVGTLRRELALMPHRDFTFAVPIWKKRSEEHTSELQSLRHLVCRLLLEKKKKRLSYMAKTSKSK